MFQQLIYRDVEQAADGSRRMLPEALDLPAALGSDTALAILNEQGEDKYPNYGEQMETVRAQLDSAPAATWTASLRRLAGHAAPAAAAQGRRLAAVYADRSLG